MVAEPGRRRRAVGTCLVFLGLVVLSGPSASIECFAGTVDDGTCREEHRFDAETRDGGRSEYSDTKSTASLDVVDDRHQVTEAASR